MGRCLGTQPWRTSCSSLVRPVNALGMSISTNQSANFLRPMPAPIRPELGGGFDEEGQICVLG
jgi:hypothetical protein